MDYGCLPTLFYIFVMAEDKSSKDNKTKYLKELEMLKQEYENCYGDCAGDRNLHKLSLLMALFQSSERFEKIGEDLKKLLIIDIDRDVDYEWWGNPASWTETRAKSVPSGSPLSYETIMLDTTSFANKLADMMPPSTKDAIGNESKNELMGRTYEERSKFKDTISNLQNEKVFNGDDLDYAINKALQKLCNALLKIPQAIESRHDNMMYEALYKAQKNSYTMKFGADNRKAHLEWKKHSLYDDISEDSLRNHAEDALVELFKAKVLDGIEANVNKAKKAELKKEIDFCEHDIPRGMKPYDLYACLRDIYDYMNGKYYVNKAKAGRLIFMHRKDEQKIKSYFDFDFTLMHVNNDIDELRNKNFLPSKIDDIDFETLECRFSEEQVKEAGISQHAAGILSIIDQMKATKHNNHWLCFYYVLRKKGWINDNLKQFCEKMNSLFAISLNHRTLNREKKKEYEANIEDWPESTTPQKEKKAFAMQFKRYVEAYVDYKVSRATLA